MLEQRKQADPDRVLRGQAVSKGLDAILKKIGEEATETVMAAKDGDREKIVWNRRSVVPLHGPAGAPRGCARMT